MTLAAGMAATTLFSLASARADAAPVVDAEPSETAATAPWYAGGTLHKASGREWISGSQQNQLATASDWALTSKAVKAKVAESGDMEAIRPMADQLRQCVNVALSRHAKLYASLPASDVATTCLITLQF